MGIQALPKKALGLRKANIRKCDEVNLTRLKFLLQLPLQALFIEYRNVFFRLLYCLFALAIENCHLSG